MNEVRPPWVVYPEYFPGHTFWRQAGQPYLAYTWEPFWNSLSSEEQSAFLDKWDAPEDWRHFYSPEYRVLLDELDADVSGPVDKVAAPIQKPATLLQKIGTALRIAVFAMGCVFIVFGIFRCLN